jgi:hypothetical protein
LLSVNNNWSENDDIDGDVVEGFLISSSWDCAVVFPWEADVTETLEKLSIDWDVTVDLLIFLIWYNY